PATRRPSRSRPATRRRWSCAGRARATRCRSPLGSRPTRPACSGEQRATGERALSGPALALPVAAAAGLAGLYAASAFGEVRGLHDWLVPGAVWRTPHPHVVLTFDDGPDPQRTPRLLDALARAGARAAFFVLGQQAQKHPDLVRRIVAEGHQLGNHSFSHPWMLPMRRRAIEDEIDRCQAALADITGQP